MYVIIVDLCIITTHQHHADTLAQRKEKQNNESTITLLCIGINYHIASKQTKTKLIINDKASMRMHVENNLKTGKSNRLDGIIYHKYIECTYTDC